MEEKFFQFSGGHQAPACRITNFLKHKNNDGKLESSYPLGLTSAPLWELLPAQILQSMQVGLTDFIRKMRGFETGNLIGLESKTSSPVQVVRQPGGLVEGFENLYIIGEGSGYAGGIISSGADGIKAAMALVLK
jgi:uncharacterized FAD-dependent dehydrogenase